MNGPAGDADLVFLMASSGNHGVGSATSSRNFLGISFLRSIPIGPRVVQFFWFNPSSGHYASGIPGSWSGDARSPHTCLNCHGGYITTAFSPDGNLFASLLPFDLAHLSFSGALWPGTTRVIERASQAERGSPHQRDAPQQQSDCGEPRANSRPLWNLQSSGADHPGRHHLERHLATCCLGRRARALRRSSPSALPELPQRARVSSWVPHRLSELRLDDSALRVQPDQHAARIAQCAPVLGQSVPA